jgi:hypothetical protein
VSEPTKCYAVTSGAYSEYRVHAVYRRREDAEARVRANNEAAEYLLDGEPYRGGLNGLPRVQKRPRHGDTYDLRLGMVNSERKEPVVELADGRAWMTKGRQVAVFPDALAGREGVERLPDGDYETTYAGRRPELPYSVIDMSRVSKNPAREWDGEARVEEFDYYEGEPLPAPLEGEG